MSGLSLAFAALLAVAFPQARDETPRLELERPQRGEVTADSPVLSTPGMIASGFGQRDTPERACRYALRVPESGTYWIDATSLRNGTYLVLMRDAGEVVAEGFRFGRLEFQLDAGAAYDLFVCATNGWLGPHEVVLHAGPAPVLSPSQQVALELSRVEERKAYWERQGDPGKIRYADELRGQGYVYLSLASDLSAARRCYEECLAIVRAHDPDHWIGRSALFFLTSIARIEGDFERARALATEGLELSFEQEGPESQMADSFLNELMVIAGFQGRRAEAVSFGRRAWRLVQADQGSYSTRSALARNNLAFHLLKLGQYEEARAHFLGAAEVLEQLEPDGQVVLTARTNLVDTLLRQGLVDRARAQAELCLELVERSGAQQGYDHSLSLGLLADVARTEGRLEEALELARRSHRMRAGLHFSQIPSFVRGTSLPVSTLRQAEILILLGEGLAAAELLEPLMSSDSPFVAGGPIQARARLAMAQLELLDGHPEGALAWLEDEHTLEPQFLIRFHETRGQTHLELGDFAAAFESFASALRVGSEALASELATMSEGERFRFFALQADPSALLGCALRMEDPDLDRALAAYLDWKGKLTRIQRSSVALRRRADDERIVSWIGDLQQLDQEIADLVVDGGGTPLAERERRVRELRERRVEQERELNRELDLDALIASPAPDDVLAAIPAGAVVLDFLVGPEVFVWILGHDRPPRLLSLGDADELRELQRSYLSRNLTRGAPVLAPDDDGRAFAERLWGPLREAVRSAELVWIAPDGFLCELSFDTLPTGDGRFLIEDQRVSYLSDASQLVDPTPTAGEREGSVLAVGDVNYFRRTDAAPAQAPAVSLRSRLGDTWTPLDGTREELAALRGLHRDAAGWSAPFTQLDRDAATEEAVRAGLPGHRYLHLATHGYFEPEGLPSLLDRGEGPVSFRAELEAVTGMLPGLLSGLVLAGVNAEPEAGRDDGYLTAEDVAYLDLSACDLAVLSACSTALGSARAGHGLMSLRRAFEVAGARTVVSSLWRVDDRATATLMKHFYEGYWLGEASKLDALREARLRMLRQNRADFDGDARPETWGAFVLSGDWR